MSFFQSITESIGKPIFIVKGNRVSDALSVQNIGVAKQQKPLSLLMYGDRLRYARKLSRLTQGALARKVGMSQPSISELETNVYPSSSYTAQLADALRVNALWLADGRGPMSLEDHTPSRETEGAETTKSGLILLSSNSQKKPLEAISAPTDRWPLPDEDFRRFAALPPEGKGWALAKFADGIAEAEARFTDKANTA